MRSGLIYLVFIIFCIIISGCGVKSPPFLNQKIILAENE
jgi:hypothetical protein